MFNLRFFEGAVEDEAIVDDVKAEVVPRVGETISFRFPTREIQRYSVMSVDYLYEVDITNPEVSDCLVGVRVGIEQL
jgi:hypothetical protein